MTSYVTSVDGTQIAFDRLGQGPPVVVVSGMFCDRQTTQKLAEQQHTVLEGRDHGAPADVVAPVVAEFFTTWSREEG